MTLVIAELGINHNGDPDIAIDMITAAAEAGCDGVKTQSYRVQDFLPEGHEDWDMFQSCEIWPHLDRLARYAHGLDLLFGTTPSSIEGIREAVQVSCDFLKNGSDFLLRHDMIRAMVATGLPTWVATGMANLTEIKELPRGCNLMVCTSIYPCPDEDANLRRLYNPRFRGFSDHTIGSVAASIAAFLGVEMIEKHFTLDKAMGGSDHWFSADPHEMGQLVRDVHRAEKMRGTGRLAPAVGEIEGRRRWRVTEHSLRS